MTLYLNRANDPPSTHGRTDQAVCPPATGHRYGGDHPANHAHRAPGASPNNAAVQVERQGARHGVGVLVDLGRGSGEQPYLPLGVLLTSQETGWL